MSSLAHLSADGASCPLLRLQTRPVLALHLYLGLEEILNFNLLVMDPDAGSGGVLPKSLPSAVFHTTRGFIVL